MNEPIDSLEAELQSLRPHDLSSSAKQRIANELEVTAPTRAASPHSLVRWSAPIVGLVAACLAAGLLLLPSPDKQPDIEPPLAPPQIPLAAAFDDALPTVWTYRRALARSPRDLEVLLDKHSALTPPSSRQTPTHLFIQSDAELLFNGEL